MGRAGRPGAGIGARADVGVEGGGDERPRIRPDLRLIPGAVAAWTVVLIGLLAGPLAALLLTGLAVAGLVLAVLPRHRRRPWASGALAAAGCAAAAGVLISAHAIQVRGHPLADAAERGAAATLRVELADDPRPIRDTGYAARPGGVRQVLVPAEVRHVQVDDGSWAGGGRVLLLAPPEGWTGLLPGQFVTAEGLLAPAQRRDLTVAVLRVRGPPREVGPPSWWQAAAGTLRDGLRDAATVLPEASAGLLPGLAVGDTRNQTAEVEEDFRAAGLTHLTAVSGVKVTR